MRPLSCILLFIVSLQVAAFSPSTSNHRRLVMHSFSAEPETQAEKPSLPVKCPECNMCDGSGRILGGIAVVLPWWPIKAYRPCPNFIDRGGIYERSGQGLDEIAFGRDSTFNK
ncbi:hypothetical protein FisN_2Hh312 [Fistulifera solaris]|uniref:Uncharacterized protein n=1 Tax=Fistulifera solaris TaxID=1519565 RepID=A0A1Z5KKD1_FISSO|nr:hypothetical protein FisN_2Hh312 [Fistulifera solaris]|eukprot:GAX26739.1 hypothetical protein FisN_2Hh312 [Fistulifera solaris]